MVPSDLRYTRDHEWARVDGTTVTVGITDHAQKQLGDIVYVEFHDAGSTVGQDEPFGTVESTKSVSDLMAPVSGKIAEVNQTLIDDPAAVNRDPYGVGWIIRVAATDLSELDTLMSAAQYEVYLRETDAH